MTKWLIFLTLFPLAVSSFSKDILSIDEISMGIGESKHNINIYRLGAKKNFESIFHESDYGWLSGYYEASLNYWDATLNHWEEGSDHAYGIAFSPVFVYYIGDRSNTIQPYVEAGIGLTYISETHIKSRNMSTHFQFEDRIGLGIKSGSYDFNARYMHYSNANIKKPNDGLDIIIFTIAYKF